MIELSKEDLQLIYAACMSYGEKLSDMTKGIPNEEEVSRSLYAKAKEAWKLDQKITEYMED